MATVNDIGVPGSPLNSPPLTEWQAAVRDAVNSATAHGTWTAYVPVVTGATYSSVVAEYTQVGGTVVASIKATVTAVTGDISFSPPVPIHANAVSAGLGTARLTPAGGTYLAHVFASGATAMYVRCPGTNGSAVSISPTVPATWASGNSINFVVTYHAA